MRRCLLEAELIGELGQRPGPRPKSEARRSLCRWNALLALLPTTSIRRRLAPRAGTAIVTWEPRRVESQVSNTSRSAGSVGTRIRGGTSSRSIELPEERRDELGAVEVLHAIDDPSFLPRTRPPRTVKTWKAASVVLGEAHDVQALGLDEDHLLALQRPARRLELVAEPRRLLVLLPTRRLSHLLFEAPEHRLRVPREEVPERVDVAPIGLLRDPRGGRDAGTGASADVVVETGSPGAGALVEEVIRAGADREDAGQRVQGVPDRPRVPVRPEVADLLPLGPAEDLGARPRLPTVSARYGYDLSSR